MGKARFTLAVASICLISVPMAAGCSRRQADPPRNQHTGPAAGQGTEQGTEQATEAMTEQITEAVTEEVEYRNILEVMDEDTRSWIASFDAKKVDKLVYTIRGEEKEEYEITDTKKIRAFFDALIRLQVAGAVELFASDAGDTFDFYEDEEKFRRFSFCMGSIEIDGVYYETDDADELWELTGSLLGPM